MTLRTPGTANARVASKRTTLPAHGRRPGNHGGEHPGDLDVSAVDGLAGDIRRPISSGNDLPRCNSSVRGRSTTSFSAGTFYLPAASANSPKPRERPVGTWVTT